MWPLLSKTLWRIFTFNILGVQPLTFSWEQAAPYVTQNWEFKLVTFANWTYWNCTAKQILYLSQILKEIALFCFNVRITSGPFLIFSSCFSSYFRCERSVVCFSFRPESYFDYYYYWLFSFSSMRTAVSIYSALYRVKVAL